MLEEIFAADSVQVWRNVRLARISRRWEVLV